MLVHQKAPSIERGPRAAVTMVTPPAGARGIHQPVGRSAEASRKTEEVSRCHRPETIRPCGKIGPDRPQKGGAIDVLETMRRSPGSATDRMGFDQFG
jgi:hypothetical protein